jgi:histidine ammonia-lyase
LPRPVSIDRGDLRLRHLTSVARGGAQVVLGPEALARIAASREVVERAVAAGAVVYGVTTGFGRFSDIVLPPADAKTLQRNLIVSHATGVGPPFGTDIVRGMLLLRANALALGHSGVRPEVVKTLIEMLNRGVHPVVPQQGSLGASGDLAPLAHLALVAIGEGSAHVPGRSAPVPGREALAAVGLAPLVLEAKEGLALINGTQAMTATLGLALWDALLLVEAATVAAALSLEALRGVRDAFDPRVAKVRPHPGQAVVAERVRSLIEGSRYTTGAAELRVQDAYCLRCVPQVHGAVVDTLAWAARVVETEMNAVTDNPLVFPAEAGESGREVGESGREVGESGREVEAILSGGNFHGEPVAFAGDFAGIALAELANISERRTARLVDPACSAGLPAFLTQRGGLNSGFMLVQYTAAALVSENKVLASPASVDSIPSSAGQEDHVSMGTIAARKARDIAANTARVVAAELLTAAQAIDLRGGLEGVAEPGSDPSGLAAPLGRGTRPPYLAIRRAAPFLGDDRSLSEDIERVAALVLDGQFRWE